MLQGIKNIRYYFMCMLAAVGMYSWSGISAHRILGDDNENKDGQATTGTRRAGGHGFYYHK